jgi:hypothetical protein
MLLRGDLVCREGAAVQSSWHAQIGLTKRRNPWSTRIKFWESGLGKVSCPAKIAGPGSQGLQTDLVINRFSQSLLAAQVTLSRLHADVPEQELDLLQLAA